MTPTARLDAALLRTLRHNLRGEVVAPSDPGYEKARRVWNGRIDRRPGAVVRCAGVTDVIGVVNAARENGLPLAVRGGGHDYAGRSTCDGGLVLDLSRLDGVRVDPEARRAWVEGGARWNAVDRAAQAHGLATTGGTVSTVGVAGYTLGGGTGHLARRFGLGLDNLVAAEVVTADGEQVVASEEENPDLFWALRGGSGNFGVVTSFEFALHEVGPEVFGGQIVHRLERAPEVLRAYRDFMAGAPDELQCYAFFIPLPPLDVFPAELHGEPVLDLVVAWTGDVERGEEVVRPLRELGEPVLDGLAPQQYVDLQTAFDPGVPPGQRWLSRACYLEEISDAAIHTAVEHAGRMAGTMTMVYFEPLGGAIGRVDPSATAFPHRDAGYSFHVLAGWSEPSQDAAVIGWTKRFHGAMAPHARNGVYVNLLADDEQERVPEAYGANHDRLARIKAEIDPGNLLRMNHNVPPAG